MAGCCTILTALLEYFDLCKLPSDWKMIKAEPFATALYTTDLPTCQREFGPATQYG